MKSKHYVKKYSLDKSSDFDHNEFARDMTFDFMALVEYQKACGEFTVSKFETCVDSLRDKWDGINNKTIGQLPEKLWNYLYASVITELKNQMFPEIEERRSQILAMSDEELEEHLDAYGIHIRIEWSDWSLRQYHLAWEKIEGLQNNRFAKVALQEAERRGRILKDKAEEEREKERAKWTHSGRRFSFEDFFFGGIFSKLMKGMAAPSKELNMLGLSEDCTEEDVKKAYRTMSLKHHPDRGGNQAKFIEVTEAKNKVLAYLGNR